MPFLISYLGANNFLRNGLLACGMAFTLSFTASPGVAQSETVESSEGSFSMPILQVGTAADYVPFEFKEPGEDEIIGFDIDVATYIAQQLGFVLQIQDAEFGQLLPAVAAGELDFAIAAITPTLAREQTLAFSEPYYISRHAFVSRQSDPIRTLTDIVGKTVVVQRGSVQETALLQEVGTGLDVDVMAVATTNEMVTAVRELQADVAILEELVAVAYLENNPTLIMDVLGELDPSPIAIAFPQGSPYVDSFNQIIADMEVSGELAQLAKQWFTANP